MILIVGQFAQCPALNETLASFLFSSKSLTGWLCFHTSGKPGLLFCRATNSCIASLVIDSPSSVSNGGL